MRRTCLAPAVLCALIIGSGGVVCGADRSPFGRVTQGLRCSIPEDGFVLRRGDDSAITLFIENTYSSEYKHRIRPLLILWNNNHVLAAASVALGSQSSESPDGDELYLRGKEVRRYTIDLVQLKWGYDGFALGPKGDVFTYVPEGAYSLQFINYTVEVITDEERRALEEENKKLPPGQSMELLPYRDSCISNEVRVTIK